MSSNILKSNWFLERLGVKSSVRLLQGCNKIGRKVGCNITISDSCFISREHCEIIVFTSHIKLIDYSSNGTYINEQQIQNGVKILNENDKIGIGVNVADEDLTDSKYHIYILKKINNLRSELHDIKSIIMCPAVIDLLDSDSDESVQNVPIKIPNKEVSIPDNESNYVKQTRKSENKLKNVNENQQEGSDTINKLTIVSNIVISAPNSLHEHKQETLKEKNNNNIKLLETKPTGKQSQVDTCVYKEITKVENVLNICVPREVPSTSNSNFISCEEMMLEQKPILTIDIVSDDEVNSNSIVFEISDDEDYQRSQYLMQDIKQEIYDFDFEDVIHNKVSPNQNSDNDDDKHEKLNSPVYDLLNEDNEVEDAEEFDEKLANWYIKLSQGIVVKKELKEEIDNNNVIKPITEIYDIPQLEEVELNKFEKHLENKTIPNVIDIPHVKKQGNQQVIQVAPYDKSNHLLDNENKNNYKIEKNKIPQLIDAPCLPIHKGKLRGVSADRKSNSLENKKISIIKKDKKLNREQDLKETWLSKPNICKEKKQNKKIHEDRKEKLKLIADREIQKRKISDPQDTRSIKKPKVKITTKNRGAFLTELPSYACSKTPSISKRKNSEIENGLKFKKIPKISPQTSLCAPEVINKCQSVKETQDKLITHKNISSTETRSTEKLHFNSLISHNDVEKRPQKIRFRSLTSADDMSKIQVLPNTKPAKSILLTQYKSQQQRIVKKVRFNEKPHINYFDVEMTDAGLETPKKIIQKDLSFNLNLLSERKKLRLRTFSLTDHTDLILSEILTWNAHWLESGSEEVNGPNHLLMPMIHQFQSLTDYKNIVFPLLKLEMWVHLSKNFKTGNENNFKSLSLNGIRIDDKVVNKRIIYNCQYSANKNQSRNLFLTGDFLLVQINSNTMFAYVRENSFMCNTDKSYYIVTIESKFNEKLLPILNIIKNISVKKLSSITIELGQFNAVSRLKYSPLLKQILNPINLSKAKSVSIDNIKYEGYHKLNDIQKDILLRTYVKCINPTEPNITLIEGPPGTGKSRLVTNLVLQILYGKEVRRLDRRILICAPSNAAVDVITLQLIHIRKKMTNLQARFNLVRFGVVERMHPDVRMYSLTGLIEYNRKSEKNNNIRGLEIEKKFIEDKIRILKQNNNQNSVDQDELHKLKQNLDRIKCLINPHNKNYDYDKLLYSQFLSGAHIICSTLTSCVKLLKYIRFFDVCVIDEATQCSEPWSLIPFQFAINSLILVGDKQQLPATVLSKLSKDYNYGKSLFTRISDCVENNTVSNPILSLRTQYRMHPEICRWPNLYFYKNKLINDSAVKQFKSKLKPYFVFNLQYNQNKTRESGEISNTLEATFVVELIKHIKEIMPFEENKYGIISPYSQHRDNLQKQLKDSKILEVTASTIDSYQGKEKDIIIISNGRTEGVGFLCDVSRLNVSLTRAKKCLILCGNFSNLNHLPAWRSLLNDAKSRNIYCNLNSNEIANFKENVIKKIVI